jgi:hypothetical protein
MSIANLNGGNVIINDLKVRNIDTPNLGDALTIGTVNAAPITIGKLASEVLFGGRIRSAFIDTNAAVNPTLFIGADPATGNIQLGHAGVPITVPAGVITPTITRGGSVGIGTLDIGGNLANSAVTIGNLSAPITLIASSLIFPGSAPPLEISESRAEVNSNVFFTGALVAPNFAVITTYRFGEFVTIDIRDALAAANRFAAGVPISMVGALGVGYRPAIDMKFICLAIDNGANVVGQCNILANGTITVGSLTGNDFAGAGPCGFYNISYTFNINN